MKPSLSLNSICAYNFYETYLTLYKITNPFSKTYVLIVIQKRYFMHWWFILRMPIIFLELRKVDVMS